MKLFLAAMFTGVFACTITIVGCSSTSTDPKSNPLLSDWEGPYQGLPPFDKIEIKHFKPALQYSIKNALASYQAIAQNPKPATFENTMLEMEKIEASMNKVFVVFSIWGSSLSTPELQKIEQEMAPKLAAFVDQIIQNKKLFERIETVYKNLKNSKASPEKKRLAWMYHTKFIKGGAALTEEQKKKVSALNQKHAQLTTQFSQNLLGDEAEDYLLIEKQEDLAGLPSWLVDSAKKEAEKRKLSSGWVISNTRSSMQPFLTFSARRPLREKAFKIWSSRGENNNKYNNSKVVQEILKLRAQRSKIFGFDSYAHWQLSDKMAKEPKNAMKLLMRVWKPAVAAAKRDIRAMQKLVDKKKGGFKIQPWDHRYYAEKLRKARYDFDADSVKPYLQLGNIRTAMFWMAKTLYGFEFKKLKDIPVFHPEVSVYEVSKAGEPIGLWYFDPFARKGKNSGAWMNAYRVQNRLGGKNILPIVSNNSNFIKESSEDSTTISWDDAATMFHEFGHALHGLASNVTYPSLAGTSTARDFVEFPSQIHEDWLPTPEVLKFLRNSKGEPLPKAMVQKIKKAAKFNEGFRTVEYLASALVDMKLHLIKDGNFDPKAFEKKTLRKLGMPRAIVMRHRIPQFAHIFSGEGYSAGYYSYMWADVLRQDAFKAFLEGKGPYDSKVAKRFYNEILSVGNTVDPGVAFRNFRGRGPNVKALLQSKGFSSKSIR